LTKLEWNRVWSPNFIMNAKFAYYSTGFTLAARGDNDYVQDFVQGRYFGNPHSWIILRPQTTFRVDNSYFVEQGGGSHEIKFGFGYKDIGQESTSYTAGNKTNVFFNTTPPDEARFYRESFEAFGQTLFGLYIGDTFSLGRMNLYGAVRYDRQKSENLAGVADGNPLIPGLLPGLEYGGGGTGVSWNNISPRFGITYALDEEFKTVLRGSFSRYHGQQYTGLAGNDNPLGGRAYLQYAWQDLNGDRAIQTNEVDFNNLRSWYNVDPNNPSDLSTPNRVDPDLSADIDYEFVVGVDREIVKDFGVGAAFSWRRSGNFDWYPDIGVNGPEDYEQGTPVTTDGFTSVPFVLRDGVTDRPEFTGGTILTNREDFYQRFWGIEFTANKRLSNKWMSRVTIAYNKQNDYYDGTAGIQNPTFYGESPSNKDGATVMRQGSGSGASIWFSYGWTFNATGLYQLPWDMEIAGNIFTRQGYPWPHYHRLYLGPTEGNQNVWATEDGADIRFDTIFNMDVRFAKNFMIGDTHRGGTIAFEIFNLFNTNVDQSRQSNLSSSVFGRLDAILSPRIARIVAKVRF
jgi:hypothetical protein